MNEETTCSRVEDISRLVCSARNGYLANEPKAVPVRAETAGLDTWSPIVDPDHGKRKCETRMTSPSSDGRAAVDWCLKIN